MAYETGQQLYHRVELEGRDKLTVSGVEDVERFDEGCIVMATCEGTLIVTGEGLHIGKLSLDGGELQVDGRVAVVEGVTQLTGAPVQACDLRAGAALVIAVLAAQGETELTQVQYIERGYEDLVGKLRQLGADIRVEEIPEPEETEAHIC